MKVWTVYQVENLTNGRLYIGVHKTADPNDEYMGSGKYIRFAIEKYGLENFRKTVLLVTESKEEAFALEKSLVTIDRIESGELYNLKQGGEGGWDFCNTKTDRTELYRRRSFLGNAAQVELRKDEKWRTKTSESIRKSAFKIRETHGKYFRTFEGKSHSEETKKKMSESKKVTSAGSRNSQYGTIWITDGSVNKKIRSEESIPDGWKRGRR